MANELTPGMARLARIQRAAKRLHKILSELPNDERDEALKAVIDQSQPKPQDPLA
jgi:hypothetical protein